MSVTAASFPIDAVNGSTSWSRAVPQDLSAPTRRRLHPIQPEPGRDRDRAGIKLVDEVAEDAVDVAAADKAAVETSSRAVGRAYFCSGKAGFSLGTPPSRLYSGSKAVSLCAPR